MASKHPWTPAEAEARLFSDDVLFNHSGSKKDDSSIPMGGVYIEPESNYHRVDSPQKDDGTGKPTSFIQPRGFMHRDESKIDRNPYTRWKEKAVHVWKHYTDFGNPLKLWKPILANYVSNYLYSLDIKPAEERRTFWEDLSGAIVENTAKTLKQTAQKLPYDIVPALRNHLSAAEGVSDIKHIYLYKKDGGPREYLIYAAGEKTNPPDSDLFREQIEYVDKYDKSPYQDNTLGFKKQMVELFDSGDGPPVLKAQTFFDWSKYFSDEPDKLKGWGSRMDCYVGNQLGPRNIEMENNLPPEFQGKIRIYERPVDKEGWFYKIGSWLGDESPRSGTMWFEWAVVQPLVYAIGDLLMEPLEAVLEGVVPRETMRTIIEGKMKTISSTYRGFRNPRPDYLYLGQ